MLTITCIQAKILHLHTQGRFNNHTAHSFYRIMVMAMIVVDRIKMGNIMRRAGTKATAVAFQAGVLTKKPPRLPDVTTLPMPVCLCSCSSLPDMAVQSTTILSLPDLIHICIQEHKSEPWHCERSARIGVGRWLILLWHWLGDPGDRVTNPITAITFSCAAIHFPCCG